MSAPVVKIKGVTLCLGGCDFVIPPLSLGALEQLQERIAAFTGDMNDLVQVATVLDTAHAALRRNYPGITRAEVAELIDLGNMLDVFQALMNVSGLLATPQGAQEGAPGEAARGG